MSKYLCFTQNVSNKTVTFYQFDCTVKWQIQWLLNDKHLFGNIIHYISDILKLKMILEVKEFVVKTISFGKTFLLWYKMSEIFLNVDFFNITSLNVCLKGKAHRSYAANIWWSSKNGKWHNFETNLLISLDLNIKKYNIIIRKI